MSRGKFCIAQHRQIYYQLEQLAFVTGNQLFFLLICLLSFGIAGVFAVMGVWLVLPFAGFEMLILALALYVCISRACVREVISIEHDTIEVARGGKRVGKHYFSQRAWAHVVRKRPEIDGYSSWLVIRSRGKEGEVGSCLNNEERSALANALEDALYN